MAHAIVLGESSLSVSVLVSLSFMCVSILQFCLLVFL